MTYSYFTDIVIKLIIGCFMENEIIICDLIGSKPHLNTAQLKYVQ